jgi:hypothetical protein
MISVYLAAAFWLFCALLSTFIANRLTISMALMEIITGVVIGFVAFKLSITDKLSLAADIATTLGEGLQAFCIPGSVGDDRKVGLGHGNLAAMLLREETKCFAFLFW